MSLSPEQLMPIMIWLPVAGLFFNFLLMTFLIFYIQKGKFKPKEQQIIEDQLLEAVKQAQNKAVEIIEDATGKAHKIILEAQGTKHLIEEKLNKFVNDTADSAQNQLDIEKGAILEKFKDAYGRLVQQFEGETQVLLSNLQHEARDMQTSFRDALQKESSAILKQMRENAEKQMLEANKEIKEYREQAFAKIDEQVQAVIKQYIADYFSTEMTKENHESILFKAFEKFKKSRKEPSQAT